MRSPFAQVWLPVLLGLLAALLIRSLSTRSDRRIATGQATATDPEVQMADVDVPATGPVRPVVDEPAPNAGSALPGADGEPPSDEYTIKGKAASKLYHTPQSPYFRRTRADVWFRTEDDAKRAGFTGWARKPRSSAAPSYAPAFEEGTYPGSARPARDGAAPTEEFVVKGDEQAKRYHTAESPDYASTRADVWFRSEADAQRAGFVGWASAG